MSKIYRTDLLTHQMNPGKEGRVRALLKAWRKDCIQEAQLNWQYFFENGYFNKNHSFKLGHTQTPAGHQQMIRYQVIGQLESFMANRKNDFRKTVNHSQLPALIKHKLNTINSYQAWYTRLPFETKNHIKLEKSDFKLSRKIMNHVLHKHHKPDFSKANMMIDQRGISFFNSIKSTQFDAWIKLSTLEKNKRIYIPLITYDRFNQRTQNGELAKSIQVIERDGKINFGLMTDMSKTFSNLKANYQPKNEVIALDLGLKTLFATHQGDLLGRDWLEKLKFYDQKITKLAAYRQQLGEKERLKFKDPKRKIIVSSQRYKKYVQQLRGWIKSEINRILNNLIKTHAPKEIVIEKLNFQNSNLSKRLNKILSNFGKSIITTKLNDLQEKYGIIITEVEAAYTSQACSKENCGYVDKRNRQSQEAFTCLWCGNKQHADVNAARNIISRRSGYAPISSRLQRQALLTELIKRFNERVSRQQDNGLYGKTNDPRLKNPYFKDTMQHIAFNQVNFNCVSPG